MMNFRTMALAAVMTLLGATQAFASQDCNCRYQTGRTWPAGGTIVKDFGKIGEVSGFRKERDCSDKCKNLAINDTKSQAIANLACSKGVGNGSDVNAISKAGLIANGGIDHFIGKLVNTAAVLSCPQGGNIVGGNCVHSIAVTKKCPAGWLSNSNVDGGVTTDGQCKRAVVGCNLPAPLPANGTQIAGYGFTWGNSVVQMGNAGNGGAAIISCPSGYSVSGNNCVKTYPVTVTSPAVCKFQ